MEAVAKDNLTNSIANFLIDHLSTQQGHLTHPIRSSQHRYSGRFIEKSPRSPFLFE